MIIHSKPCPGVDNDYNDWNFRGSIGCGKPRPDKPKEEEKPEFFSEEEFKI